MKTRILGIALTLVLALGGAVVLTGYVRTADARALAGAKPVHVYVATRTIPSRTAGAELQQFVTVKDLPAAAALQGRVTSLAEVAAQATNSRIERGEQVLASRFSDPAKLRAAGTTALPKDKQAVSVKLPLEQAVAGTLHAGDLVGVVIADGNDPDHALAKQKLHKVLVTAVHSGDALVDKTGNTQPPTEQIVTLALGADAVTAVVWGQKFGTVWLSLETPTSDDGSGKTIKRGQCKGSACTTVHP